jgi:hypothetical protein
LEECVHEVDLPQVDHEFTRTDTIGVHVGSASADRLLNGVAKDNKRSAEAAPHVGARRTSRVPGCRNQNPQILQMTTTGELGQTVPGKWWFADEKSHEIHLIPMPISLS